jgi:molybdopterin biosynthesis enzyme
VPLPIAVAVDAGDPLPEGTDAVAASESIVTDGGAMQAVAAVAGGDGVLAAGADAGPDAALLRAGVRLNALALAAMQALGISRVAVRKPRVRILTARASEDAILAAVASLLRMLVTSAGGEIIPVSLDDNTAPLSGIDSDFIVIVGGSGTGARDLSVQMLAHAGQVAFHGVGISPGETVALGNIGKASVLVVPGRLDAAFAAWVTLGAEILSRLSDGTGDPAPVAVKLARKITSTIGMVEVVPVRLEDGEATPLASGYLSLGTVAQADGYIVVPAESEGFPPGTQVAMRKMP